jgi:predicted phosphodiesterase
MIGDRRFILTHANPLSFQWENDSRFSYVEGFGDIKTSLENMKNNLIAFIGHTHSAWYFQMYYSGVRNELAHKTKKIRRFENASLAKSKAESTHRTIINLGSVGQPRDGLPPCYAIVDPKHMRIYLRTINYDQWDIINETMRLGLAEDNAKRLHVYR